MLSIGSLFYVNLLAVFPIIWAALIIIRPFNWREWTVSFIGLFVPYLLAGIYYNVFEHGYEVLFLTIFFKLLDDDFSKFLDIPYYVMYGYIGLLILLSSFHMFRSYKFLKIAARNFYLVYLILFLNSILIVAFIPAGSLDMLFVFSVPLSFVISNYLLSIRKEWIANIIILGLVASLVYVQYAIPVLLTN